MGFRINGEEIINDDGVVNAELGEKAVTELPDGVTSELSNIDELPIYDAQSGLLKRFTIGEIETSGLLGGGSVAALNDIGDVDVTGVGIGSALVWNGTNWVGESATNISPSGAMMSLYRFSNNTTMADPGTGRIRVNNADQSLATAIAVDVIMDVVGTNMTNFFLRATKGSRLILQTANNADQITLYSVNEDPTLQGNSNSGWISFGSLTPLFSTNQNVPNNASCVFAISYPNQLENVSINPSHVNTPTIQVTAASGIGMTVTNDVSIAGSMTAGTLYGDGSQLTGINAGDVDYASVAGVATNVNGTGIVTASEGFFGGSIVKAGIITSAIATQPESNVWLSVTYGDGKFVAISQFGTNRATYSTDGISWTPAFVPEFNFLRSVTYGDGKFVAVSSAGTNRVLYSTDGINWTSASAAQEQWESVTYGDGKFVAVSVDGTNRVMYSTDGINWTSASATESNTWYSVTYGDDKFVAVSTNGTNRVMYSADGISWTAASAAENNNWLSVTYGNGKFVAVAESGTNKVMYSTNGISWTAATAAEDNTWESVTYADGKFVAVADSGTNRVMYSSDGISWTAALAAEANGWRSVTYGDGKFVAVADNGTNRAMYSTDGINWSNDGYAPIKYYGDGSNLTGISAGSVAALDDIGDVDVPTPTNGQMLAYNSSTSEWEAVDPVAAALPAFPYNFVEDSNTWVSNIPTAPTMSDGDILLDTSVPGVIAAVITANDINGVNRGAAIDIGFTYDITISFYYDGGFYRVTGNVIDAQTVYGPTWAGLLLVLGTDALPTGTVPPAGTSVSLAVDIIGGGGGSVASLNDIGDVSTPAPSNNDVLTYNSTTSEWEAQAAQTGSANPGGLQYTYSTNTDAGNAANGEIRFNGTQTTFGINVNDRNGVSQANFFSAIATGLEYLVYIAFDGGAGYFQGTYTDNVANTFRFTAGSFTGVLPGNNDNVEVTITPAATSSGSVASLNDIGDVSTPSPSNNQVLTWTGTQWEAQNPSATGGGGGVSIVNLPYERRSSFFGGSVPSAGEATLDPSGFPTILSINKIDDGGTDRTSDFGTLTIGNIYEAQFGDGEIFTGEYAGPVGNAFNFINGSYTLTSGGTVVLTTISIIETIVVLNGDYKFNGDVEIQGDLDVTNGGVITGDGSGLTNVSDTRWKTGITTIGIGMSFIEQVNPIRFQYQKPVAGIDTVNSTPELTKWDYSEGWELRDSHWRFGFSAQELSSIEHSMGGHIGIAVTDNPEQYQMRTESMLPILVNAVKELKAELTAVQAKNVELEGRIADLENP